MRLLRDSIGWIALSENCIVRERAITAITVNEGEVMVWVKGRNIPISLTRSQAAKVFKGWEIKF